MVLTKRDVPSDGAALYGPSSDGDIGTSYENTDLGLPVSAGDIIAVDYEMSSVDATTTTTTTSEALANTGTDLTAVVTVAAGLVVAGAAVLVVARRRRA